VARAEGAVSGHSPGLAGEFDLLPEKLYVELTSRCNLRCPMCVKYAPGSSIGEEDLPLALFRRLESALARAQSLVLNGIGDPCSTRN
jgi:MoaA/NifB/PqqE/SkfB family radical SAM enzyme